ncbi:hypothetical protein [Limosilactobacillus reuteri]|uniref:hypothetical protein n=1 Tax=Limosilactobacillus reuteri TaxID=1598 RepID=UPI002B052F8B|nr:hypothetical protein [Limosilactobacillus reuteri]
MDLSKVYFAKRKQEEVDSCGGVSLNKLSFLSGFCYGVSVMVAGLIIASWIAATINNFALVSKITVWIYLIAMFVGIICNFIIVRRFK